MSRKRKCHKCGAEQPRVGRPIKPAVYGERATLSMMVTPSIKAHLDAAAHANGRTRSQEAEVRIERSVDHDWIVRELMKRMLERAA